MSTSTAISDTTTWDSATSVGLVDSANERTKSLASANFTAWVASLDRDSSSAELKMTEFIVLSNNCFIRHPKYRFPPEYRAIPPSHPQLAIFEHDALMLTNKLAQNPLVISTATACMYYPTPSGTWPGNLGRTLEPFPVLCLDINNKEFLGHALQQISVPIHLSISSHPIRLLTTASSDLQVTGPLFPGNAIIGEGGQGTFGAYLYPTHPSPGDENIVWGLTCGHVASKQEVTSHLRKGLCAPSVRDIHDETFNEYNKKRTESFAEIDASHHNQPLYSHSIQMIDSILSDRIYNNFDKLQLTLETRRDEAHSPEMKAAYKERLDEVEKRRRRRKEFEQVKGDLSLARVATAYRGEFGYVPESPPVAFLPTSASDPGESKVKPMISTDWLLVKVERAAEMVYLHGSATPGDIIPGRSVKFTYGNHDGPNSQCKGIVNGMKAYISDCGVVTSEWALYPKIIGRDFAGPGDSGGVAVDSLDGAPVGLIFAGTAGTCVFVKPLKFVLDRVELVTGMRMNLLPPTRTGPSAS